MATNPDQAIASSPRQLLSLGLFVFGMDTLPYNELERSRDWRHAVSERHGARPATQFVGPGEDSITINGLIVPEFAGSYGSLDRLIEMADTGDNWPLVDGKGRVWGDFYITALDTRQGSIMAGGFARKTDFALDLVRKD